LLHVGKPDVDLVERTIASLKNWAAKGLPVSPASLVILTAYCDGKHIWCDSCQALTGEDGGKLKLCSCRSISYCGRACQSKMWQTYNLVCRGTNGANEALVKPKQEKKRKGKKGRKRVTQWRA